MKRLILIGFFFLQCIFLANAQDKRSEIESLRISVYTQKIGLTPAESKAFWPVYEAYQEERGKVHDEKMEIWKKIRGDEEISDSEMEALLDRETDLDVEEELVHKKYHAEFKKVLPIEKVARLYQAEYEFKKELIRRIGDRRK